MVPIEGEIVLETDAIQTLATHSGHIEGLRLSDGITGMLRPYQGLIERNIHEVMECLFILSHRLSSDTIDTIIPLSILKILSRLREWGIEPEGMLRRNHLIDELSLDRLTSWASIIDFAARFYLSKKSH